MTYLLFAPGDREELLELIQPAASAV